MIFLNHFVLYIDLSTLSSEFKKTPLDQLGPRLARRILDEADFGKQLIAKPV